MPFINFLDQFTSSPISPAYADYLPLNIGATLLANSNALSNNSLFKQYVHHNESLILKRY
jgi:hypothetical protein